MINRRIIEVIVLGLWLSIAVVFYIKNKHTPIPPQIPNIISEEGKTYEVSKITVVDGHTFDLTIKDDRILVKLSVVSVDRSKGKVLDLLHHSSCPSVTLRKKQNDGVWVVDLFFINESGEKINLTEWLIANKLVYK